MRGSTFGLGARLDPGVSPTSPLILTQKNRQQNLYTLVLWILKPACHLLSFYSRPELLLCKRNLGFVVLRVLIKLTNVSALYLAALWFWTIMLLKKVPCFKTTSWLYTSPRDIPAHGLEQNKALDFQDICTVFKLYLKVEENPRESSFSRSHLIFHQPKLLVAKTSISSPALYVNSSSLFAV